MLPKLRAIFYSTSSGREPVREWLMSLRLDERKQIGTDIAYVQFKWPIGKPRVDHLRTPTEDIALAEARWKEWHDAEDQ